MPIVQSTIKPTSGKLLAVDGNPQRPTEDNMQTGRDFVFSALAGMSVSHSSSGGSGSYAEKGHEHRGGRLLQGTTSSRHQKTDAHTNTQRPCQHTQDLHRLNPDRVSAWRRASGHKVLPLTKKLL